MHKLRFSRDTFSTFLNCLQPLKLEDSVTSISPRLSSYTLDKITSGETLSRALDGSKYLNMYCIKNENEGGAEEAAWRKFN